MEKKELILLRGLPGSGKSTFAKTLGGSHIEADSYFVDEVTGVYKFNSRDLPKAHNWCQDVTEHWMSDGEERIIVSNTFTQLWEMDAYFTLAKAYGYKVYSLIVENRHGGVNEHGVPREKLDQMKERFNIQL